MKRKEKSGKGLRLSAVAAAMLAFAAVLAFAASPVQAQRLPWRFSASSSR